MVTMMMKENSNTISKTIKYLTDTLVACSNAYYQDNRPLISDQEFDMKMKELEELERQYPNLALPYSPTRYVGSDRSNVFAPVKHIVPMQSLENTYNEPELLQFVTSVQQKFPDVTFVTEYKIDGLSISCLYEDGALVQVSTRGNGEEGDDVTRNAVYINGIPIKLKRNDLPHTLEIRGEAFMNEEDFKRANTIRKEMGLEAFANPRNAASGILKSLDQTFLKEHVLSAVFYHVALADEMPMTQEDMFHMFDQYGIAHMPFYKGTTHKEILEAIGHIATDRKGLIPVPTDGAVVKVNEFSIRLALGQTSKYPRWAKAYKFAAEQVYTTIKSITIQIGRTGVLTPVAELDPVQLCGSVVKRATLHNSDIIRKLDIRVGDTVLIEKAGEVIPHVLCSVRHEEGSKPYYLFEQVHGKCPCCGHAIVRKNDEVAWKCVNDSCPGRIEEQIVYATGKHALDINCLGRVIVRALIKTHHIKSFAQLFDLREADFEHLPLEDGSYLGINGKKIYESLQNALHKDLANWLTSFGISGVGPIVAKSIASQYPDLINFTVSFKPQKDSVVENNIAQWIKTNTLWKELLNRNINPVSLSIKRDGIFHGKTFVITGKLSRPREEIEKMITDQSGHVSNSISKSTTFLIKGEDKRESTKTIKAKELGITTLTEEQFLKMIGGKNGN